MDIELQLPVCPRCNRAGKIPRLEYNGKYYCVGPEGKRHKREQMKYKTFKEVSEDGDNGKAPEEGAQDSIPASDSAGGNQ